MNGFSLLLNNNEYFVIDFNEKTSIDDFIINYAPFINEMVEEDIVYFVKGLTYWKTCFETYSEIYFVFNNHPEVVFKVNYGKDLPESKVSSKGLIGVLDESIINGSFSLMLASIWINKIDDEFSFGLEEIKLNLKQLLACGDLSFMDSIIDKHNLDKKQSYKLIAKACNYYLKKHY